jgi:hypothetical protein
MEKGDKLFIAAWPFAYLGKGTWRALRGCLEGAWRPLGGEGQIPYDKKT